MSGSRRRPGRLGRYVDGYRVPPLELGYSPLSVLHSLAALGHLARWMDREGMDVLLARLGLRAVEVCRLEARYSAASIVRAVVTTSSTSVARCSALVSGCRMQARSVSRPPKTVPVTKARPRA
jgi:hypothetical protein